MVRKVRVQRRPGCCLPLRHRAAWAVTSFPARPVSPFLHPERTALLVSSRASTPPRPRPPSTPPDPASAPPPGSRTPPRKAAKRPHRILDSPSRESRALNERPVDARPKSLAAAGYCRRGHITRRAGSAGHWNDRQRHGPDWTPRNQNQAAACTRPRAVVQKNSCEIESWLSRTRRKQDWTLPGPPKLPGGE